MNMIKCEKEHIYDADKFDSCPHCANIKAGVNIPDMLGKEQSEIGTLIPAEEKKNNYRMRLSRNTVGWLVCTSGTMKGESFVLREGENAIGRAQHMDVVLSEEPTVSRNKHAVIVYEKPFVYRLERTSDHVLHNGKSCQSSQTLSSRDRIQLGDCELIFIPLCDGTFSW